MVDPDTLPYSELPSTGIDDAEHRLQEIKEITRKARARPAPGPNRIPYKAYKNCPKLLQRLWKLIKVVWRRGHLPDCWPRSEGCFIPKEEVF